MFSPQEETLPREELRQLQLERLQATVSRIYRNVAFYGQRFDEMGFAPEDVASLDDLSRLPLTTKQDLRDSYPYGMFALPLREVVRIHASSGTTGQRTVVGYSKNDLNDWTELAARNLVAAGVGKDDVVQIFFGYGLFTAGFGFHQGAEAIAASVIPVSSAHTARQVEVMQDFRTTVLIGTPSYALEIAQVLEEQRVDPHALSLRVGLFGAEPWSEETRQEIERRLYLRAYDIYGIAAIGGPGVAGECVERHGLHIAEDHFLPEIIDPVTGEPKAEGESGELVFTTLSKEAFPLLRYRTGDIVSLDYSPCPCGRTLVRMSRIFQRTDDVMFVRGTAIAPADIAAALQRCEALGPNHQIIIDRQGALDVMEVHVELLAMPERSTVTTLEHLESDLAEQLRSVVGMKVEVRLHEPRRLQAAIRQHGQIVDHRKPG